MLHATPIFDGYSAILHVNQPLIPRLVSEEAIRWKLNLKPEFHITVLGPKSCALLAERTDISTIEDVFKNEDWEYNLLNEYYVLHKQHPSSSSVLPDMPLPQHSRSSLIQAVDCPSLTLFYEKINTLYETNNEEDRQFQLETPFAHVTLYAGSDYAPMKDRGIGVYSYADLQACTEYKVAM